MLRQCAISIVLAVTILANAASQNVSQKLTNNDVVEMKKLGFSDDVILEKIRTSSTNFNTSLQELKTLKAAGISDAVIKSMIGASAAAVAPVEKPARITDELTTAYRKWQNSVFTVWSETGHGSGFLFDRRGLILTNQHVVGPSEYVAVQFDPKRKIRATVLATNPQQDVAVLWADVSSIPEALPVVLATEAGENGTVVEGERVFTIGSPLNQRKAITTGIASKIEPKAIISDININHGNSGGPLFNSLGVVVGITTFGDFTSAGGPGISGILRIEQASGVIKEAVAKMASYIKPRAAFLPVEPAEAFPIESIKAALQVKKFNTSPYFFEMHQYQVTLITPVLHYYLVHESEVLATREKEKRNKKSPEAVRGTFRPLDDLKNWGEYVGEYKPLIIIRATPKLDETGGSFLLRTLVSPTGAYIPPKIRFVTDFYKMSLVCGGREVMPIHPGKIAHVIDVRNYFVRATDATYEGFYSFPPDVISPACGEVSLELYSEKNPEMAAIRMLDKKTVQRIWDDFEGYRSSLTFAGARSSSR